jgi:hypothetical protein
LLTSSAQAGRADGTTARRPRVLIFVYDAGETLGLLPATPILEAEKIDVRWAPLTPWALRVLRQEHTSYIAPPGNLDNMPHVKDRENEGDVGFWSALIAEEKPDLVIVGLVSCAQERLARELKARGIPTVGFYDAFDPTTRDSIVRRVASQVDTVWVPTKTVKRNLTNLGLRKVKVMGQPSLETWYRLGATVKPASLYAQLQIPPGNKILLFAGQYGEGYAEVLEAFLRAALVELRRREDLYLVLSYHPKTTGEREREAIQKYPHPRIRLMPQGTSTAELATISGAVITWRSTVGIQAAFLGNPVIYFNLNLHDYTIDLIEQGIAVASTPETFGAALHQALTRQSDSAANRRRLAKLGYVIEADRKIASEIIRLTRRGGIRWGARQ